MKRLLAGVLLASSLVVSQGEAFAAEPSAICKDGTYSYSQSRRGTCSGHGGVSEWLTDSPTKAARTVSNDPDSPCGSAIENSAAPLRDGWVEYCDWVWPSEWDHAAAVAIFGPNEIHYRVEYAGNDMGLWKYLVAHERCHSLGYVDEIETDYCALEYGGNSWRYGYLSNL